MAAFQTYQESLCNCTHYHNLHRQRYASYFFAGCNEGWPVAATESSNSTSCGTESTKSLTN
ncbi:hypothetical protein [Limosilactobacillus reuteri]|uniref:hypothetical protein n=1 Tax=Limosilactobacillus reuteri TaxID=1598 RepID=UPI001551909D|nr:hypothetical protein [Limosilactobacillus reuteri]MCC4365916.1 hypothetical protein [Limosilactobacillus reuteri]MCC4392403.1 hypothetical protein [Limosilactobacillus reuteri]MCC4427378.1 hypothetical protein [Limosilactobacillus reuteri]MCC4432722.1 hypothetical protein [Limosilactobacillus reuteri]MCC4433299.1 hypothetical protein [Limosilactobacillus reuteri]